jgi:hypothetical protein
MATTAPSLYLMVAAEPNNFPSQYRLQLKVVGCPPAATSRSEVSKGPRTGVVHASTVGDFDSSENGAFQFRKPMVAQKLKLACPLLLIISLYFWSSYDFLG